MQPNSKQGESAKSGSVRSLMERLIDYAGLFPPAQLSMEEAIQHYHRDSQDQDGWMLGRFVVPDDRLAELLPFMGLFTQEQPLPVSMLGSRSADARGCIVKLAESLGRMQAFGKASGGAAVIDTIEQPLPPVALDAPFLGAIAAGTTAFGLRAFCELTYARDAEWASGVLAALDEIAAFNARGGSRLDVKLRTGGVAADAFPAPDQVAIVLEACRVRGLALKFTAGLHHPLRMFRPEAQTKMHGFLNVFAAGMLAHAHKLDRREIAAILEDERPEHFQFTDAGLRWNERFVSTAEVSAYRSRCFAGFGSCSFDEPREELRALGLLEQRS